MAERAPSINARVVGLSFFETPTTATPLNDRVYKTNFDKDTTRHVAWGVNLSYPAHRTDTVIRFDWEVRDVAGQIVVEERGDSRTIPGSWNYSYHFASGGQTTAGSFWDPGWYSVKVSIDGGQVAKGWFQVTEPAGTTVTQFERELNDALPWLIGATGDGEKRGRAALLRVWQQDPQLAETMAGLSWVANEMSALEPAVLDQLATLAGLNTAAAQAVLSWPWVEDGIDDTEWQALRNLAALGEKDHQSLADVAQYAWMADEITQHESSSLDYLAVLADGEPTAARAAVWPWVQDGITEVERWALLALSRLAESDKTLGSTVQAMPWVADDMQEDERWGLRGLSELVDWDIDLVKRVAGYPWVADGTNETEWRVLHSLGDLLEADTNLGNVAARYTWATDEISEDERWALVYLAAISDKNIAFAQEIAAMDFMDAPFRARDHYALASIWELMDLPEDLANLTGQPWFADGLNDEDAAFVAMLADINGRAHNQFRDLMGSHFARSATVNLPLAGEVDLTAFRRTPFQRFDDILNLVEDSLRATEQFMGIPFPQKDVLLLFIDPLYEWPAVNDASIAFNIGGRHMLVTRQEVIEGDYRGAVAHEISHYYWHSNAPLWLTEGGADFLSSFTLDWNGYRPLPERKTLLGNNDVAVLCQGRGVENLQYLITLLAEQGYAVHADSPQFYCNYAVGEYFLINVYEALGEERAGRAWQELYLLAEEEQRPATENEIYQAFLRNTSPENVAEFNSVYSRWHGGPIPTGEAE